MNAIRFIIAFALLLLLGAGTVDAQVLRIKRVGSNDVYTTTFSHWEGWQNGTAVVIEVWPTTACTGTQGSVPGTGIPVNFGAIIFNDGSGLPGGRTYAFALSNNPLNNANGALVEATVLSSMATTMCDPSTAPGVAATKLRLGNQLIDKAQAFASSWNYSGGKATLAIDVVTGVAASCTGTGTGTSPMRAPLIGMNTLVVGLQSSSRVTANVDGSNTLTVTAIPEDPAFTCSNLGTFSPPPNTIFASGFE